MKSNYKKFADVGGTGGINCRCCCPRGGKKLVKRLAKRTNNRLITKLANKELND